MEEGVLLRTLYSYAIALPWRGRVGDPRLDRGEPGWGESRRGTEFAATLPPPPDRVRRTADASHRRSLRQERRPKAAFASPLQGEVKRACCTAGLSNAMPLRLRGREQTEFASRPVDESKHGTIHVCDDGRDRDGRDGDRVSDHAHGHDDECAGAGGRGEDPR
jgi:hypothetical protein